MGHKARNMQSFHKNIHFNEKKKTLQYMGLIITWIKKIKKNRLEEKLKTFGHAASRYKRLTSV